MCQLFNIRYSFRITNGHECLPAGADNLYFHNVEFDKKGGGGIVLIMAHYTVYGVGSQV